MRFSFSVILFFYFSSSFGQKKLDKIILINSFSSFDGAFVFFPLTNDTIQIDKFNHLTFDTTNGMRKLFYCCFKNEKSKIYNLDIHKIVDNTINFKIPDQPFFDSLYKSKTCPLCHKNDMVVPFIYGKPSDKLIRLAVEGKVKLAGCMLSNTSPKLYCKRNKLEF
ncbi:MAG TPA: hypothetical protein VIH86_09535 [Puia sp.]